MKCEEAIQEAVYTLVDSDRLDPFFLFGYQLRKHDEINNRYTRAFLKTDGKTKLQKALLKIVISNYYDQNLSHYKMRINNNFNFKINLNTMTAKWFMLSSGPNKNLFNKTDKCDYNDKFQFLLTE